MERLDMEHSGEGKSTFIHSFIIYHLFMHIHHIYYTIILLYYYYYIIKSYYIIVYIIYHIYYHIYYYSTFIIYLWGKNEALVAL